MPHVLEIAFGTDRPTFGLLDIFYDKRSADEGKTTFKVPYHLAPVNASVLPLMNKDGIPEKAQEVFNLLTRNFIVTYDRSAAIGKRYLRNNEIGTPFCITIDYESLENDDVTIRDRDSEEQKRVKIDVLPDTLRKLIDGELAFQSL